MSGVLYTIDLSECRQFDPECIRVQAAEAIRLANGTILNETAHVFPNGGATFIYLLAESHMSVHTWPEKKFAAIDLFGCGGKMEPLVVIDELIRIFDAELNRVHMTHRKPIERDISLSI